MLCVVWLPKIFSVIITLNNTQVIDLRSCTQYFRGFCFWIMCSACHQTPFSPCFSLLLLSCTIRYIRKSNCAWKYLKNTHYCKRTYLHWHTLLLLLLSRMRNLLDTPLQVPLLLSLTTTRKLACSSVGGPTPSAIHLWRNASLLRVSRPTRGNRLLCADNSLLTQNCCRAGNSTHTSRISHWICGRKEWSMHNMLFCFFCDIPVEDVLYRVNCTDMF